MNTSIETKIVNLSDFYNLSLSIPDYQRPYKWNEKNIRTLFDDLDYFVAGITDKNRNDDRYKYRLGTIVLHKLSDSQNNIVDGQQRTLTFYLIRHALAALSNEFENLKIAQQTLEIPACRITQENLRRNYGLVEKLLVKPRSKPLKEYVDILLNKCEFVLVELNELSEAFQFFDSQNSRGLDLYPHDLLKAYHLREFDPLETDSKAQAVKQWEQRNDKEVHQVFSQYLYPIRQWTKGKKAFRFTKEKIYGFKGLSLHHEDHLPFSKPHKILHSTVDEYNSDRFRKIDNFRLEYPFQITQTILNGRRFFEWFTHYECKGLGLISPIKYQDWVEPLLQTDISKKIWKVINGQAVTIIDEQSKDYRYSGLSRTGDGYIRKLLNAFLLAYYDKFGEHEFSSALEIGFIWAYSLRLQQSSVYESSIENHVVKDKDQNLFMRLNDSLRPKDFFNYSLKVDVDSNKAKKVEGIETLFKEMKYMAGNV